MSKEPVHNTNMPSIGSSDGRTVTIVYDGVVVHTTPNKSKIKSCSSSSESKPKMKFWKLDGNRHVK